VKVTRESLRAKKEMHRNITDLHDGRLLRSGLERVDDNTVRYTFAHKANDNWGSKYIIEVKRDDLLRCLETMEG
jgi:hypothetical protein